MKKIAETTRTASLIMVSTAGLLTLLISVGVRPVRAEEIDSVVASVDGDPITTQDLKTTASGSGAISSGGFGVSANPLDDPDVALKNAIAQRLIDQEAEKYASKVDDDEVDRYIQNLEQQNHITDEQLRAQLRGQNTSYDEFRAKIRKPVETMTMIDREVRQKIVIPDNDIDQYYKHHPDEFTTTEEKFQLAQILIAVPAQATPQQVEAARHKADDVREQAAKPGANFVSLALQYSNDDSRTKGGELGEFSPGDLNDAVLTAIKTSKTGDLSPVVKTKYGFHIVKVERHQMPGLKPLDQVRGEIRDKLMTEQAKDEFQKWIETDLIKQHYVETLQQ